MKYTYYLNKYNRIVFALFLLLLFSGCATSESQYGSRASGQFINKDPQGEPLHTVLLAGNGGDFNGSTNQVNNFKLLSERLKKETPNSSLLFLGDNIYPSGMSAKDAANGKQKLSAQIALADQYKGQTFFIPGHRDWDTDAEVGLKRQRDFINTHSPKISMLPRNGCGITSAQMGEQVTLIAIDSQWYLQNWDKNPTINDDCNIKNREDFFLALEEEINNSQLKTVLIAIHHPLLSNGKHGGQYSLRKNLFPFDNTVPLPVIGSAINFLRKTSGANAQDLHNKKYSELIDRITTLISGKPNILIVSGHDESLQYIDRGGIKQLISGSLTRTEAARAIGPNDFSFGGHGYAVLDVYKEGETHLSFFGIKNGKEQILHKLRVFPAREKKQLKVYPTLFPVSATASVYNDSLLKKSGFHNFLWGKHYRKYYGQKVTVRSVGLDTLYGGVVPVLAGKGELTNSFLAEDRSGRQFLVRGLQKDAVGYIQTVAFKNQPIGTDLKNTYAENFVLDFYTSSHPYMQFAAGRLAKSAGVSSVNPELYYIPKQNALGNFAHDFGDAMYLVEEYPANGGNRGKTFGSPIAIVGTDVVLQQLRKDDKYKVDEKAYIRARLFDMLIGDWNRDQDHWRWGVYNEGNNIVYRPIPIGRDQAFTKYDGALLFVVLKNPAFRHMQTFNDDIKNVRWFNARAYPLDLALLKASGPDVWQEQAAMLQKSISDSEIETAFALLPSEVKDETAKEIVRKIKARRSKLDEFGKRYYKILARTVLITGTDMANKFEITRLPGHRTSVKTFAIKERDTTLMNSRIYDKKLTKDLWVYAHDGDDIFEVKGKERTPIRLRLFGGLDKDQYNVIHGNKVRLHDLKSGESFLDIDYRTRKSFNDDYELNNYDFKRPKYNAFSGLPNIGYNPDDGIKVGVSLTYTVNGLRRNPYSQRHNLRMNYYFATEGYEALYKGLFPEALTNWLLQLDAQYTSPNFSFNFFGYGNETVNIEDRRGMDYNRVRAEIISVSPTLIKRAEQGGYLALNAGLRAVRVQPTEGRFISAGIVAGDVFSRQDFASVSVRYGFENYDVPSNPTLGMKFYLEGGYEVNIADASLEVPHLEAALGFSHKILSSGRLVFASLAKTRLIFSNDYEFYQTATIGGDFDVRAFRSERFTGKQSFFQSSDLRLEVGEFNNIVPLKYGILGGFDYGRVWLPGEHSEKWHTSYGGGVWLNGINLVTAKLSYFHSSEGGRVSFGLGFGF